MININCKIYNFISYGRIVLVVSVFLCFVSCIMITMHGLNWGIDFTGGILIEVITEHDLDINKLRNSFIYSGFKNPTTQYLSDHKSIVIRLPITHQISNYDPEVKNKVIDILNGINLYKFTIQQITWIGPSVNSDLINTNIIALLVSLVCILIYLTYRFELRLAIGTVISLMHDILIIIGILSIFSIEINLTIIAALISAIGYSLNNNIIIFNRIKENFSCLPKLSTYRIFNISLSQVLNRTIITSVTTIVVLLILLIFGGDMLYEFSITLLLGVVIGTISSIYIASVLAYYLKTTYNS